jgi:hypothetical protein
MDFSLFYSRRENGLLFRSLNFIPRKRERERDDDDDDDEVVVNE